MNRTAIFYSSCLLIALPAIAYAVDNRDRANKKPAITVLQQASSSVVLPSGPINSSQQTAGSNGRDSRNSRTVPAQGTQSVQSPPVVNLNDLQVEEFAGIQTLTIVSSPSLFDSETTDQKISEEAQEQPEETTDMPQLEEIVSNEPDQPVATEVGPAIAIGYYTSEPPVDQENDVISQL